LTLFKEEKLEETPMVLSSSFCHDRRIEYKIHKSWLKRKQKFVVFFGFNKTLQKC